jgi:CRP-like cAMP-binding protein
MDLSLLSNTALFRGDTPEEIEAMLKCLGAEERRFQRGETIMRAGVPADAMGMVLSGSVSIESDDVWGNKSVLSAVGPGQVFAETYACVPGVPMMVSAVALADCSILFMNAAKLLQTCPQACSHHVKLIRRLLQISSQKNLSLSHRIFHTAPKSIRGRLLSYLSFQAETQGSYEFTIPFNRQQLADYLSVDRSAMSSELGKMSRDGLIQVDRNHFRLNPAGKVEY